MNAIIVGIILAALGAGSSWYYKQDAIASKNWYEGQLTEMRSLSEKERKQSAEKVNAIETERVSEKATATLRAKQRREHRAPVVTVCTSSAVGVISAAVSDSGIRLLRDAANDPRLSPPDDPTGFVGPKETVTADSIDAYSHHTLDDRNQCAVDFNALLEMCK